MRFTATWHPSAEDELAEIWMRSAQTADVALAANATDQLLGSEPYAHGEEFYGDWLLVVLPLVTREK